MIDKYKNIIDLKHFDPKYHTRMPMANRSAQFAPFAALTGFGEAINEAGRAVDKRIELTEDEMTLINDKINYLIENKSSKIEVNIVYFVPDKKKIGGTYQTICGVIRRIDAEKNCIVLNTKHKILIKNIYNIVGNVFNE